MNLFLPLDKYEVQADGTLRVFGIASSEARDSDNEITRGDAIRKAIPGYLRYGSGALREMHQALAAGKVDEISVGDDNITRISAHVVDPTAVTKVKHGVYKGFSIGGKVTSRSTLDPREITGCDLIEISLVDRPANPEATINLWKADMTDITKSATTVEGNEDFDAKAPNMTGPVEAELVFSFANAKRGFPVGSINVQNGVPIQTAEFTHAIRMIFDKFAKRKFTSEEREAAAKSGAAMKDGSYPIENKEDLHNAIHAVGRGTNNSHAAIRAHIKSRAKAIGAESELPESWGKLEKSALIFAHLANVMASVDSLTRNPEWESVAKAEGASVEQIKEWLGKGATVLAPLVTESSREIARIGEDIDSEFELVAKAAEWVGGLGSLVKTRAPQLGEKVRLGGADEGTIEALSSGAATVRTTKGHLQEWVHKDSSYNEEEKCWVAKRGARHNSSDMTHIQGAHDHLAKLGAVCGDEDAMKLGKAIMALNPSERRLVELLTKVAVPAPLVKSAEDLAAEAVELAKAAAGGSTELKVETIDFGGIIGREMNLMGEKFGKSIADAVEKMNATMGTKIAEAIKPVTEKVDALAALPEPAKGAIRAITKVDDGGAAAAEAERLAKADIAKKGGYDPLTPFKEAIFGEGGKAPLTYDFLRPQQAAE